MNIIGLEDETYEDEEENGQRRSNTHLIHEVTIMMMMMMMMMMIMIMTMTYRRIYS
jgi:hypothetical protein